MRLKETTENKDKADQVLISSLDQNLYNFFQNF
jgi:hypothetical protein